MSVFDSNRRRAIVWARVFAWALASAIATAALPAQQAPPPPQPQAAFQPMPAGTGAVSGVVIDGSTNRPINGAVVNLFGTPPGASRGYTNGPGRLATDAQGRFVFPRLPVGSYSVTASKHGYTDAGHGQTIQLADGQWFADGRIVMWKPSAISGTVTDEAGEPMVGVLVRVVAQVIVSGRPQLASGAVTKTDDRGRYRMANLPRGRYIVMVPSVQASIPSDVTLDELTGLTAEAIKASEAAGRPVTVPDPTAMIIDAANRLVLESYPLSPGRSGWSYPTTAFPTAQSLSQATPIDLGRAEERSGVDIRLAPVRTVRVTGVVDGPAESKPSGMTVRLLPTGSEGLGHGSETATSLVSAAGTFTLLNVPAGRYTLIVSNSTMELQTSGGITAQMPRPPGCLGGGGGSMTLGLGNENLRTAYSNCRGSTVFSARTPLTVGDRDLANVAVTLVRAVSVSGSVVYADGAPPADSPMARIGFTILAEPANGDPSLGMPTGRSTQADSMKWKVDGLLPGSYVLRPSGPSANVKSIEWQGRDYFDRPFDATAGRDIEGVVITVGTGFTRIRGTVRDAKGATATSGVVIAFPVDQRLWTDYGLRPTRVQQGTISSVGAFSVASLPPGEYYIVALDSAPAAGWISPAFFNLAAPVASRVTLTWAENKTLDLSVTTIRVGK